jgi:parvulin-like peptidyl-prolyl isomerase
MPQSTITVRRSRRAPGALVALLALPLLAGCSSDRLTLSRVGERVITVDDFVEVARGHEAQYPGSPDTAKARLLLDLERRALMLCDAERRGMYRNPVVSNYRRLSADDLLLSAVFERIAPRNVPVSEAEVEQFHAWRDSAAHVRLIYAPTGGAAGAARAELERGASFASIADRFSGPGILPPGGDLGFLLPGSLVPPLDGLLRTAPTGRLLGPIEVPGEGWFIIEVVERRPNPQPPLDERQRHVLTEVLRQRKQRTLAMRALNELRSLYELRIEPGAGQALFAHFNAPHDAPAGAADLGIVLARWRAGSAESTYTLGRALADLATSRDDAPDATVVPALARWVESRALRRLALYEARRRHLDEEPAIARRLGQRVDNYVMQSYYDGVVAPLADLTPADTREAYERNRHAFVRLGTVRLLEVTLPDSAAAVLLLAHAGHAPSLREAVAMAAPGTPVTTETVRFPDPPGTWKTSEMTFLGLRPNQCVGPVRVGKGWLVAQLVSKDEAAPAFEKLPAEAMQWLQQQAAETKRDRTLDAVTAELRGRFKTESRADRLKRIPWPVPAAATPGS